MSLTPSGEQRIIKGFEKALAVSAQKPGQLYWLYNLMPDFMLQRRDKGHVLANLTVMLSGSVEEMDRYYVPREGLVLKLLKIFAQDDPQETNRNRELLLKTLIETIIDGQTMFEQLYDKMNDWGGEDNFTATMQLLYAIWTASKYSDASLYSYENCPEKLAYQSDKILGFYSSGYGFSFNGNSIEISKTTYESSGHVSSLGIPVDSRNRELIASCALFQPLGLSEVDQDGELKLPELMPAFYLKAFDDKNAWANFEKTAWIAANIAVSFTAVVSSGPPSASSSNPELRLQPAHQRRIV